MHGEHVQARTRISKTCLFRFGCYLIKVNNAQENNQKTSPRNDEQQLNRRVQ